MNTNQGNPNYQGYPLESGNDEDGHLDRYMGHIEYGSELNGALGGTMGGEFSRRHNHPQRRATPDPDDDPDSDEDADVEGDPEPSPDSAQDADPESQATMRQFPGDEAHPSDEPQSDSEPDPELEPLLLPEPLVMVEPVIDSDSPQRVAEERPEAPHKPTRFDAGTGQGTEHPPRHEGKFQERPILDGSTQNYRSEATVPNPSRGQADPATVTKQPALNSIRTDRWLISGCIATIIVTVVLLALAQWSPVLCISGVLFAVACLIGMILVRVSRMGLKLRLRVDALLLAAIWLASLTVFIIVLTTSADEIWGGI